MLTALAFIFTLGLLVTVHEFGHYQVARWCGVKVLKFSIGFGKPLWSKQFGVDKTELVIAEIQLGGNVKMLDQREFADEPNADLQLSQTIYSETELKRAFNRQSVYKRIAIVLAGPLANLLLAIFLYWLLFMMGIVGIKPIIGKVIENSPAAAANFVLGDTIQKINGKHVASWQDAGWILLNESFKSKSVEVEVLSRSQKTHTHQLDISNINSESNSKDVLSGLGLAIYQPDIPARIDEVINNSPAYLAGFKSQDLVLSINKIKVSTRDDFVQEVRQHPDATLDVVVERDSVEVQLSVTPEQVIENGKIVGRIGTSFKQEQRVIDEFFVTTHYSTLG
ncbi:MAG: RIP metalloprotease RseP, partial [Methylotenera sp.]|uniref:RIP metalloprotease RseP n=1 Tax=Methylotenera sp. TaxID=2051956 RepID=UPI002730D721